MKLKILICALIVSLTFTPQTCGASIAELDVEVKTAGFSLRSGVVFARYDTWPRAELKMDIFSPFDNNNNNQKHPAVILIPGGAWIDANRETVSNLAVKFAENDFFAASIEYRLIGAASYEEIIGDAKAAVRYLRAHADELNIDNNKIAVMGFSAGGYLASMLGVTGGVNKFTFGDNLNQSSEVQAVIDCFGPSDLTRIAEDYSEEKRKLYYSPASFVSLFVNGVAVYKNNKGGSVLDTPETARDANPLNYIDAHTPPFLIFHGDADKTVSLSQSKLLHDELVRRNVPADLYIIKGGEHNAVYFHQPEVFKIILEFLNRVLK
ncbi:MAG: alpha/beta hydrolase [Synergistaceae bacterium]|nr:alpha/beta hydrolase [Synergistaceae bacterium]MBR1603784.1 alpha/beta hydrolase [Synergistaceae bacterium]